MWWSIHKNSRSIGFGEFLDWWTHLYSEKVVHPSSTWTEAPTLTSLPNLTLYTFLSGCSTVSFIISSIRLWTGKHECFLEFCGLFKKMTKSTEGITETSIVESSGTAVTGNSGTGHLWLVSEEVGSHVRPDPSPVPFTKALHLHSLCVRT